MDDVKRELLSIGRDLRRLTDFLLPSLDPGLFESYRAFKVFLKPAGGFGMKGIEEPDPITFRELRGIDALIQGIRDNTSQFLEGLPCNNVLVYGPRGTGKSSAIKALFNEYSAVGLRMIEIPKEALSHIVELADLVRTRPERFIAFCDDLSFEEDDVSYRRIKTILEGGLENRPKNMLVYATSNRRHLMPEHVRDNLPDYSDGELHPAETMEEKLSLSDRFGLRFGAHSFDMDTYLEIIRNYIGLRAIELDAGELKKRAVQWSLSHGSYSGRTARQFVDDLEGRLRSEGISRPRR